MKVNGGDCILRWYSGGIFQNTSPVEKYEDYFILTWNSRNTFYEATSNVKGDCFVWTPFRWLNKWEALSRRGRHRKYDGPQK
jgi:hypothetical protein